MKAISKNSDGKNYTAVEVGKMNELSQYTLALSPEIQIPGKAFLGTPLGTTGAEISFQSFAPNSETGFLHTHKTHEELLLGQPPVILACSANNQAVTNIIDSFTKKDDKEPEVLWLPDLKGYATYLPSSTKSPEALRNINYIKPGGTGLFARLETREYLIQARKEYLLQAEHFWGEPIPSVGDAVKRLHLRIASAQQLLQEAQQLWTSYLDVLNYLSVGKDKVKTR